MTLLAPESITLSHVLSTVANGFKNGNIPGRDFQVYTGSWQSISFGFLAV